MLSFSFSIDKAAWKLGPSEVKKLSWQEVSVSPRQQFFMTDLGAMIFFCSYRQSLYEINLKKAGKKILSLTSFRRTFSESTFCSLRSSTLWQSCLTFPPMNATLKWLLLFMFASEDSSVETSEPASHQRCIFRFLEVDLKAFNEFEL